MRWMLRIVVHCLIIANVNPRRAVLQLEVGVFSGMPSFQDTNVYMAPEPYIKYGAIAQNVDHFNRDDHRYFHQRYLINPSNYNDSGRVFLNVYGTGFIRWQEISDQIGTNWIVNAKHFGAFCFLLEHRYHGRSNATLDASTVNLKWLTIEQALADIEVFIFTMNAMYQFRRAKWILFGGSYGGALAAWSRLKFPHLITGAVTCAAAIEANVNFLDYLRIVREDLDSYESRCVDNLANATQEIERRIRERDSLAHLMKMFRVCEPRHCDFTRAKDVSTFFYQLAVSVGHVAQYSQVNAKPHDVDLTVPSFCKIISDQRRGNVLERYADAINHILFYLKKNCIFCSYEDFVLSYQNSEADDKTARLYEYLTRCSQLGHSATSDYPYRNPFSSTFSLPYFLELCMDIFGTEFSPMRTYRNIAVSNARYGGKIFQGTNVVFANGGADPYYTLSIINDSSEYRPAIFIKGVAHCADYYPASVDDPPQLTTARKRIRETIEKWLM